MASYLDDLEDDENSPYDSVSANPPLQPVGLAAVPQVASQPDPIVKQFLMQQNATPKTTSLADDPIMQQYFKDKSNIDELRQAKMRADTQSNISQALSQLAQGTSTPKDTGVFNKIAAQNQEMISEQDKDLARRQKVMESIGNRQASSARFAAQQDLSKAVREQTQANKDLVRQDKKEKDAKISEKQAQEIQDFDDSIATTKSLLGQLGNHSDWTGPVDGRIPDFAVTPEQVNFRAELGRMVDKYRKLITGAGASNQELKKLESRLPQPTDNYANFVAKAKGFVNEVEGARSRYLKNLGAQGKNTKAFESGVSANQESGSGKVVVTNGQETLEIDPSDLADAEKDGYKRM